MTRKRTLTDYALWAALPMAQSSKIERRIIMILDKTQNRRALTYRVLLMTAIVGAVAVVPLSMLQPVARAQGSSQAKEADGDSRGIRLWGVANAADTSSAWWSRNGATIPAPEPNLNLSRDGVKTTASPGQKALFIAFFLPAGLRNKPLVFDVPSSTAPGITVTSPKSTMASRSITLSLNSGLTAYEAAFPISLTKTDVRIGIASSLGTETVDCPKTAGKVRMSRPSGEVLFTLAPDRLPLTPALVGDDLVLAEATRKNAVLMVSDHFHCPSPLKIDKMAMLISSYYNPRRSGSEVQQLMHDGENYERVVYGLDQSGRIVAKLAGTGYSEMDAKDHAKRVQTFSVPRPLLRHIASFRLVARPYRWTEFKDVALQPVK